MEPYFGWLDYSEREKKKMLDLIHLMDEKDTRDELGIGSIRDAFADMLFPGTSTIQTRARYLLFVPWIYMELEKKKTQSKNVAYEARKMEVALIDTLAGSADNEGTIGIISRETLKRLPSNIYWQGLGILGIRFYSGSQESYHHYLDNYYSLKQNSLLTDDHEPADGTAHLNWHPGIPEAPEGFLAKASLKLLKEEADYLHDRIISRTTGTLLAFLTDRGKPCEHIDFPWDHPQFAEFPVVIKRQLEHAQNFSESIHGASLLYNLMLSEKLGASEYIENFTSALEKWANLMKGRSKVSAPWNIQEFWHTVISNGACIPRSTKHFVETWLDLLLRASNPEYIIENESARTLISERESRLKKGLARLHNLQALKNWNGNAGTARIGYRWPVAERLISDVLTSRQEIPDA